MPFNILPQNRLIELSGFINGGGVCVSVCCHRSHCCCCLGSSSYFQTFDESGYDGVRRHDIRHTPDSGFHSVPSFSCSSHALLRAYVLHMLPQWHRQQSLGHYDGPAHVQPLTPLAARGLTVLTGADMTSRKGVYLHVPTAPPSKVAPMSFAVLCSCLSPRSRDLSLSPLEPLELGRSSYCGGGG